MKRIILSALIALALYPSAYAQMKVEVNIDSDITDG